MRSSPLSPFSTNLALTVYDMHSMNFTVDLCPLLNSALYPLPTYKFIGSDWLALPSSLDITRRLPDIAYRIHGPEAFAQLTLTSVDIGDIKTCVQSTLSGGWSMRQATVEWLSGVMVLARTGPAPRRPAPLLGYREQRSARPQLLRWLPRVHVQLLVDARPVQQHVREPHPERDQQHAARYG